MFNLKNRWTPTTHSVFNNRKINRRAVLGSNANLQNLAICENKTNPGEAYCEEELCHCVFLILQLGTVESQCS